MQVHSTGWFKHIAQNCVCHLSAVCNVYSIVTYSVFY